MVSYPRAGDVIYLALGRDDENVPGRGGEYHVGSKVSIAVKPFHQQEPGPGRSTKGPEKGASFTMICHVPLKWVQRRNDRKHVMLWVWEPRNKYSMAHKELANKHGMHRTLLEDGNLQRRI